MLGICVAAVTFWSQRKHDHGDEFVCLFIYVLYTRRFSSVTRHSGWIVLSSLKLKKGTMGLVVNHVLGPV